MRVVDNLIALRIIYLLVTPFESTDAFKLGLIDDKGRILKKARTSEEKKATSMLHRLVWNLKRIINLAPGGSTRIGSLTAAYLLVKEAEEQNWSENKLIEEAHMKFGLMEQIKFIEEEVLVENCLHNIKKLRTEDAPANAAGPGVSTDTPTIKPKKLHRRKNPSVERQVSDFL